MLSMNDPVTKSDNVAVHERGDETYVLVLGDMMLHQLGDIESFIWNSIDGRLTGMNLAELVSTEYEVSLEEAERDVDSFLREMADAGLIRRQDHQAE